MNPNSFTHSVSGGELRVIPNQDTLWWMSTASGPFIHKSVTGDFKVTTAVKARRVSNPNLPVGPADYQFGGIMVRDPSGPPQDYVFVVVGDRGANIEVESKSTVNNASEVDGVTWPNGGDAQLRICRVGAAVHVYSRPYGGGNWAPAIFYKGPYSRPDFPATLQVGIVAYAWTFDEDLLALFDYINYATVTGVADCTTD